MVKMGSEGVQSEDDIQGNSRPVPGRYHVTLKGVKALARDHEGQNYELAEDDDAVEKIVIDFEVLAGTVPGQEGKVITEYFSTSEKAISRLRRLALCIGLLSPNEPPREVLFATGLGRQLVIEVAENEYERNGQTVKGVRIAFSGLWSVNNSAVADVPKHEGAMAVAGAPASPAPAPEPRPAPVTAPQAATPAPAAATSDGGWGDL